MTVSVTDESCSTRAEAIQINIFYPTIAQMPKIKVRNQREIVLLLLRVTNVSVLCRSMSETSSAFTKSKFRSTKATSKASVCEYIVVQNDFSKMNRHVMAAHCALDNADHV